MDESETGSAIFSGPQARRSFRDEARTIEGAQAASAHRAAVRVVGVHLRPPSIDRGVTSFLWALGLGLFIWLGLNAVGIGGGTAFVLSLLSFGAIFLFVRIYGEET